jgi:hypothetical protein
MFLLTAALVRIIVIFVQFNSITSWSCLYNVHVSDKSYYFCKKMNELNRFSFSVLAIVLLKCLDSF